MSQTRYPAITNDSLKVLLAAEPGATITKALIEKVVGADRVQLVLADLSKAHMIDTDYSLMPLADNYARMWRDHFRKLKGPSN